MLCAGVCILRTRVAICILCTCINMPVYVGPGHHGIARPQFADGGTASNMEFTRGYIEQAVVDSRHSSSPNIVRVIKSRRMR